MDTIRILYKELFTIKFLHGAYGPARSNLISDNITVLPDMDTAIYFKNHDMDCRLYGDTFLCFTRSRLVAPPDPDQREPYIKDPKEIRMRFLINSSADFIAKTFAVATGSKWVYQFSNKISNVEHTGSQDFFFLNQDVETHSIAKDYQQGTIVKNAGDLFAAVNSVKATANTPVTDTDFWKQTGNLKQVVNNKDLQTIDVAKPAEKCFGVIDIYNNGTVDSSYDLFGVGQQLLSPVYTLSFKNKN